MRKTLTMTLISTTVALSLGLAATIPAQATAKTTWTVKPGGPFSVSGDVQLTDAVTGTVTACTTVKLSGTLKSGSGLSGTSIGKITKASFSGCTLGSTKITVTAKGLPWRFDAKGYDKSDLSARIVWLGWAWWWWVIIFAGCSADVHGTTTKNGYTYLSYSDQTGAITLGPKDSLQAADVKGCTGLLNNGDAQQISGADTLTPLQKFTKS
jgi:hypothetical protein